VQQNTLEQLIGVIPRCDHGLTLTRVAACWVSVRRVPRLLRLRLLPERRRTPLRLLIGSWATGGLIVGALIGIPRTYSWVEPDVCLRGGHRLHPARAASERSTPCADV